MNILVETAVRCSCTNSK